MNGLLELGCKCIEMLKVPLVSVLIPAYNHAAFVEECLTSIARTDYPRIEVLLIDDGSTDQTFDRVQEWGRCNAHVFERFEASSRANRGLNATLNELVRASKGELICLLGSDDRLLQDGISTRAAALAENPTLWAMFADCNVIDENGIETHTSGFELNRADVTALSTPETMATELVWRWSVPGPVLMVRREVFFAPDGYGFYPEHRKVEDRDFYLWALAKGRLGFVNSPVASYRIHSSNISRVLSALTESENKDAEWIIAAQFPLKLRLGLRVRYLLYRVLSKKGRAGGYGLVRRIAQSLDWRITAFVLQRNSRRARLSDRLRSGARPVSQNVTRAAKQATTDRGA